jgi:hypothetical protein
MYVESRIHDASLWIPERSDKASFTTSEGIANDSSSILSRGKSEFRIEEGHRKASNPPMKVAMMMPDTCYRSPATAENSSQGSCTLYTCWWYNCRTFL